VTVTAIPGIIAAGAQWKIVWQAIGEQRRRAGRLTRRQPPGPADKSRAGGDGIRANGIILSQGGPSMWPTAT